MHLLLISISDSNVIILKYEQNLQWIKKQKQKQKQKQIEYTEIFERIYKSQFQFYFLIMNNQYILKFKNI
jgi:hypothetical protein